MPPRPTRLCFQLRVELNEVTPLIWRRVIIPASAHLDRVALILLSAMGWSNSHLHQFRVADRTYGMLSDEGPDDELDESSVSAQEALSGVTTFSFDYDFGDRWEHTVVVERSEVSHLLLKSAVCIDGANACPPEDSGGASGYERFLVALNDRSHDEHEMYVAWNGSASFDRTKFNVSDCNARLQRVPAVSRSIPH